MPEEIEVVYATVPEEKWNEGSAAANAWISEKLIQPMQSRLQELNTVLSALEERAARLLVSASSERGTPSRYDFFLSYSTKDEAFARFVFDVLRQAGYTIFVQSLDIPPGANFVREMQKGLANSDRVVALLSPNYVASDHCQAEWSAAYNDDPTGEKRKLVPLLIEHADLPPLMRQVVHVPLGGLTAQDAAKAILGAIGHGGEVNSRKVRAGCQCYSFRRHSRQAPRGDRARHSRGKNWAPGDAHRSRIGRGGVPRSASRTARTNN